MRASLLVSLALAGQATIASADVHPIPPDGHAIGPIVLEGSGEVPPQFIDKLRGELQAALESTDARVIPAGAVAAILTSIPELATCSSRDCLARFAVATSAGRIVTTRVTVTGELFDIAIELVDDQGRPLRRRSTRCVACTLNDAITRTAAAVRVLAGGEQDDSVSVTIRTRPADAKLSIDGAVVGPTPWAGSLVAGPHHLELAGAHLITRDVFIEAGEAVQLAIDVGHGRRFGWLTYGAAGVGVAAIVGGVSLWSIDGDGTCAETSCPQLYETTASGLGLTVLGVAALGAAGWMFWHDRHTGHAAAVPTDGGVAVVVGGRF